MVCPKCGGNINPGDKFCGSCGFLASNVSRVDDQQIKNIDVIDDEFLLETYIGDNFEKIRNKKYSFSAVFFGIFYLIYRKMWFEVLILVVATIIFALLVPSLFEVISSILGIACLVLFNDYYLKKAKKKVEKIKLDNQGKSQQDLAIICSKKGGTNLLAGVVVFIIILLLLISTIDMDEEFSKFVQTNEVSMLATIR